MQEESAALESPQEVEKNPKGVAKRWLMELALAGKEEKDWRKRAEDAVKRYRDEEDREGDVRFNILYSNIQTLIPSVYAKTPTPDIRRRFRDADPVGKEIAEVLERAASFTLDHADFDGVMNCAVFDALLPGRAVTRVKYEPLESPASLAPGQGEGVEPSPPMAPPSIAWESVEFEHVDWRDFRRGPGRRWDEVTWIAFRHRLTKSQLEDMEINVDELKIDLDYAVDDEEDKKGVDDTFKRLECWEIWDKDEKRVIWVCEKYKDAPLKEDDDPLSLMGFFPIPRPLHAVDDSGSLIPINEYHIYRDQAEELDRITKRITKIIEVLKVRGVADSRISELWGLEGAEDGEFVAAQDVIQLVAEGGLEKALWMFPVDKIVVVLKELYLQREQIKQTIYEVMGISDILRGNTKASETATAQNIKAQWGSLRLQKRQGEVQRYARDLLRLAVEIMAEKFDPMMLTIMTGKQVTPEMVQIMRADGLRSFRIDIETDSTIQSDAEADKQNITMLIEGITGYIAQVAPAVAEGYFPMDAAKAILLSAVRRFKLGREVEDALSQLDEQTQQPQGDNGQAAQQMEGQVKMAEMQLKQAESQMKAQEANEKLRADMMKHFEDIKLEMARLEEDRRQHDDKMDLEYTKIGVNQQNTEIDRVVSQGNTEADREMQRERFQNERESSLPQ